MRVGVHLQQLRPGQIGGLETYVRELLIRLPQLAPDLTLVLFGAEYNRDWLTHLAGQATADENRSPIELQCLTAEDFQQLSAERLRPFELDLWFCPLLVLEPVDPGLPSVVTLPDLQHLTYPEFFAAEILNWRQLHYPRTVLCADFLLTLSEFSRSELISRLGADPARVVAVPLAANPEFSRTVPTPNAALRDPGLPHGLTPGFLFYPANFWPHKNHRCLLTALALCREQHGSCPLLVLTGGSTLPPDWEAQLAAHQLSGRVLFLGHVPAADLPALYAAAAALVFPSLFEGFGLPVLEAMASGCPVLCANTTSLPEVAGDAALFFDPHNPQDLATQLARLLSQPELSAELRDRGWEQATRFSWQHTARATLEVLQRARSQSPSRITLAEEWPTITVVTPSFQQGPFIERTLKSVLEQGYPRLQYLVQDGASTDDTVALLEGYRQLYPGVLHYVSAPDRGQAHAVNQGFRAAQGEILGWLNSDDTYAPACLFRVAKAFREQPELGWLYGQADYIDVDDAVLGAYPTRSDFAWEALAHACYICQPTVFLRREALGPELWLDENLHTCMDYDLWIRLGRRFPPVCLDAVLAQSRMYPQNKTLRQRPQVFAEILGTVKRHYGFMPFSWAVGKAHYLRTQADPVSPGAPTFSTWLLAGWLVVRHNLDRPRYLRQLSRESARWLRRQVRRRLKLGASPYAG